MPTLTLFISSPGDVNEERVISARVIDRLSDEFIHRVTLKPIFWEHEPMLMTETFQTQIQPPSETDIFVGILWARIGTRLPAHITRPDGSRYASGTEFEFEDAWAGFEQVGKPEILIYRKTAKPLISPDMPDFEARRAQKEAVDAFSRKWFQDEEGSFIAAFNPFDNLAEFEERLESHLRKLLLRRFPSDDTDTHVRHITWHEGSPFRGLVTFEAEHTSVFFGRTRVISEVLASLRKNALEGLPFIMLLGTSGSGKSSLVRAGVLPLLMQSGVIEGVAAWRQALFRPSDCGADLLLGLSKVLFNPQGLPIDDSQARHSNGLYELFQVFYKAQIWRNEPSRQVEYASLEKNILTFVAHCLSQAEHTLGAQQGQVRLILVLDQFEEMFTQDMIAPQMRKAFVELLSLLIHSRQCWVIATFRSDLYYRCAELPRLAKLLEGNGQYLLTPPTIGELTQMIRLPAFAAGLQFETDAVTQTRLDEVILQSMADNPENLSLLSFTLDALYQHRNEQAYLTYAAYKQLGGLEGALAQRAETAFQALNQATQDAFPILMRTLITVSNGDARPMIGQRFLYQGHQQDPTLQDLLNAFIEANLIISGQNTDGVAIARIAHDALLQYWPRLKHWVRENQHLLHIRVRLKDAALQWQEEQQPDELLLHAGRRLNNAEELLKQWREALDPFLIQYIEASLQAEKHLQAAQQRKALDKLRTSRRWAMLFASLAVVAFIGGLFGFVGQKKAREQAKIAETARQSAQHNAAEAAELAMLAQQEKHLALRTQSQFLVALSRQQTDQGNAGNGVLLALEALPNNVLKAQRPYLLEAEIALRRALAHLHEYKVLNGHTDEVWNLSFSADGRYLLSASDDGTARLWDVEQGTLKYVLDAHEHQVWHASFSPDQQYIVTASLDRTARIWDTATGQVLHVLRGHTSELYFADFSPNGRYIATTSLDKTTRLWDVQTGQLLHLFTGHSAAVGNAAFSPDSQLLATASRDHTARIWDVNTGALLHSLTGHTDELNHVLFYPDGQRVLTDSNDGTARLWDVATGALLHTFADEHVGKILGMALSPNNRYFLTYTTHQTAHIWDFKKQHPQTLYGHEHTITDAVFTPDSQSVLTASKDHTLRLWRVDNATSIGIMAGHTQAIHALALSPDGERIASASADHSVRLWYRQPAGHLAVLRGHQNNLQKMDFSADSQRFFTLSEDLVQVWDSASQRLLLRFTAPAGQHLLAAALSPDGNTLLISDGTPTLSLWDVDSQTLKQQFALDHAMSAVHFDHRSEQWVTLTAYGAVYLWQADGRHQVLPTQYTRLSHARFSPDDRYLLILSRYHEAQLWDTRSGQLHLQLSGHQSELAYADFSPDNRWLFTADDDGEGRLWALPNGQLQAVLHGHEGEIFHASFSADGQRLATASWDNSIRLWQVPSGKPDGLLNGHRDWVTFVRFSPQPMRLISASRDGSVRLWDLPSQRQIGILNPNNHHIGIPAYSPDGAYLLTHARDNSAWLWQALPSTQALIDHAQRAVPRRLTPQQRHEFFLESE